MQPPAPDPTDRSPHRGPARLPAERIAIALEELEGWAADGETTIAKRFRFDDFRQAFEWMTLVAREADDADHHPEWSNVYATVDVRLTTHEVGGVTERDLQLAQVMQALERRVRRPPPTGADEGPLRTR